MSALNPTDSNAVASAIRQQAQYLADMYATVTRFYIDNATQLPDNGISLGLTAAQQGEVANWKTNVIEALKNAFEGTPIATPQSMITTISQQRPLGK